MKKTFLLIALISCITSLDKMKSMKSELMNFFNTLILKISTLILMIISFPALNQEGINNIGVFQEVSEDLP